MLMHSQKLISSVQSMLVHSTKISTTVQNNSTNVHSVHRHPYHPFHPYQANESYAQGVERRDVVPEHSSPAWDREVRRENAQLC